jgi:elongation factor Ts
MALITMDLIKELREKTQVGLMDCRKALEEAQGDLEKAIEILRKKGASVAAKRADKETNEGIITAFVDPSGTKGSLVEIACETDFAANTDSMKNFSTIVAREIVTKSIPCNNVESLMQQPSSDTPSLTVKQVMDELTAKISENIKVTRFAHFTQASNGVVQAYIHPGSKLGIIVALKTDKANPAAHSALMQLAKDICMQIAVTNPLAITSANLDPALVEKEKNLYKEQLAASGKPANMLDKIVEGKLNKFYEDVCLVNQKFIKNDKATISQLLTDASKAHGITITIADFKRFSIGK